VDEGLTRRGFAALAAIVAGPALAPAALAEVPAIRTGGPTLVVCKPDSAARVRHIWRGAGPRTTRSRTSRLRLVGRCGYRRIQAAVDAAADGTRIMILPGVYRETIAITGRSGVQLQGTGRFGHDVVVEGDRRARDVIRAERADGVVVTNLTVEQGAFAGIEVVTSDGFRLQKIVARWNRNDGVLSSSSDHGLYDTIQAYGNGESGVAVASGPEGRCRRDGIEVRKVDSFGNVLGYSGTAGGASIHDSRFAGNAAGVSADPRSPRDCSRWERNVIASNNRDFFADDEERYCNATPFAMRRTDVVCPQVPVPVGSGLILYGANRNVVAGNSIYDNWRAGVRLLWVPATARGVTDPALQYDTSNGNRFLDNRVGQRPDGVRDPNGTDVYWDEEGRGNCWSGNAGAGGAPPTSDPAALPACPGGGPFATGDPAKLALEVPCATWDARTNPDPAGCDWFTTPPEPR
jgi:hypothetical protein